MLLTITTTHQPATDLGYLLRKNPARVQSFPQSFGAAHVFYPEATPEESEVMNLKDYLKRPLGEEPEKDSRGTLTDWMDLSDFVLRGPRFLVVDVSFVPSPKDGLLVEAPPGDYRIQAKVMDYGGDRRIARLRVFSSGACPRLGPQIGETWTDTARTGLCDYEIFSQAWGSDNDAAYAKIEPVLDEAENYGTAVLDEGTGAVMPFVSSGFGDGTFPVHELMEGERRVGFEIQFIAADETYPFSSSRGTLATRAAVVQTLRIAAEKGDAQAQYQLGECYRAGEGVDVDFVEAAKWYRLACEQGHQCAAYRLGSFYRFGRGVESDPRKAREYYEQAVSLGSLDALNDLGVLYKLGLGVAKDPSKAADLFTEAAEVGIALAQFNLALLHHQGVGVPKNLELAVKWYRLAANQGNTNAQCNLGLCYLNGEGVAKDAKQAVHWFQIAASRDHGMSQHNLGCCHKSGQGTKQDFGKALRWYRKAAENGVAIAQKSLGVLLKNGQGAPKNMEEAIKWFRQSAEQGCAEAEYELGLLYANGDGVVANKDEARRWFQRAAEKGNKQAAQRLAAST